MRTPLHIWPQAASFLESATHENIPRSEALVDLPRPRMQNREELLGISPPQEAMETVRPAPAPPELLPAPDGPAQLQSEHGLPLRKRYPEVVWNPIPGMWSCDSIAVFALRRSLVDLQTLVPVCRKEAIKADSALVNLQLGKDSEGTAKCVNDYYIMQAYQDVHAFIGCVHSATEMAEHVRADDRVNINTGLDSLTQDIHSTLVLRNWSRSPSDDHPPRKPPPRGDGGPPLEPQVPPLAPHSSPARLQRALLARRRPRVVQPDAADWVEPSGPWTEEQAPPSLVKASGFLNAGRTYCEVNLVLSASCTEQRKLACAQVGCGSGRPWRAQRRETAYYFLCGFCSETLLHMTASLTIFQTDP